MSTRAVGIDLGTTFSAIAHVNRHGVPEILANGEGLRITPSVVLFDNDEIIVGSYAKQAAAAYPEQVVECVKRHIGRDDYQFSYRDKDYTAEEISSYILRKLKHDAEMKLGHPVNEAVITVPAYFRDAQRRATKRAGELAGFNVLKLINEPTAAAFAYGLANAGKDMRCLVFDLGGGTFDVTVVDIKGNDIQVVATAGDDALGGTDFDEVLVQHAAAAFRARHDLDPLADLIARQDLRDKCVSAKLSLSRRPKVNLFYDHQGRILREAIPRTLFEELSEGLLARCRSLTLEVLRESQCGPEAIDTVLLAGGSTRMPMVRQLIRNLFDKEPATDINPDECVALGAALTAVLESARLAGEAPPVDIRTHDVTSHSLGMVVFRSGSLFNSRIIRRNSRIPCERTRDDYVTTHDGQSSMDLWLVQGEEEDPLKCAVLGHFEFYGIPSRPKGETRLAVTYRYNANGIVEVEAMDLGSGQTLAHRHATGQVTLDDIAANRVPMQIALVIDCSGSMYGTNILEARKAANAFIQRTLKRNRQLAVVAFPGGILTGLTDQRARIEGAIERLTPIGSTPMHTGLKQAREALKGRAGIQRVYVILTDGHPDDPTGTAAEAHRIKRLGGRIITIGVGRQVKRDFLSSLSSNPSDHHHCNESIELEGTFINLATQLS
ncbi:MAG: molecular chaperone DnaK [Deltaproteobacteria bacterium]|nr:molecular chaperone DnaK [Deltaproteobacteria bacterium]